MQRALVVAAGLVLAAFVSVADGCGSSGPSGGGEGPTQASDGGGALASQDAGVNAKADASDDSSAADAEGGGPPVSTVFTIDTPNVVRRSNIVLGKPNVLPQDSMALGNGTLGIAVWAANGFTAQINRADTLPDRAADHTGPRPSRLRERLRRARRPLRRDARGIGWRNDCHGVRSR
jgi:hypothetical protein